ncbi:MAG: DUF6252 family protein [Chitinophagaceae bacterium]
MNHKTAFVNLLMFGVLVFPSCKKASTPDPLAQLPAASHNGANTLGCLVNGKAFVVNVGQANWNHPLGVSFGAISNGSWYISGNLSPEYLQISFDGNSNSKRIGTYMLGNNSATQGSYSNPQNGMAILGNTEFTTNSTLTGAITIDYFENNIASGTFNFDAANDSGVVVHITNGRYDMKVL